MASDPMTDQRPHERTTRTRQCTATSKRTHERCGLSAAPGRNVCKWHGGATPVGGMSHHAVKRVEDHGPGASNGRYSKFLPKNVRALADAMFNDETLFDLKSDLSLLTARVCQLGARLHGGEAGSLWRELKAAWAAFRTATVAKDDAAVRAALDEMDRLVGLGATEDAQWKELLQALAERRATILAEGKRVEQMGLSISPERVMVWGQQLIDCVLRHVRCPETRRAIATEYQRLVGVSSGPRGGDDDGTDDGVRVIG